MEGARRGPNRGRPLTEREAEILQRTEAGQSLRQIATDLHLSYTSVRTRLETLAARRCVRSTRKHSTNLVARRPQGEA